jgi:uncharacterized protein YegJ (DUF2314 family)
MKTLRRLLFVLLAVALCSCNKPRAPLVSEGNDQTETPETLVTEGYDQTEMNAAIARARSEVDSFVEELSKGNGENFAVKAPIEDNGQVEHFWLTEVVFRDGEFEGVINNDPGIVSNVKLGQKWTIAKSEISDWMFMRGGKMHGNYTMRPLLKTMPKEQADELRSILADP